MSSRVDKVAVGLGNPGLCYRRTRHNMGFLAVDRYLERVADTPQELPCDAATLYRLGSHLLAKPTTYVNRSGLAARKLVTRYGVPPERCLIVYDDAALRFGTLRARARGGSGGHRGMASVIESLGTREIPRLRLGIGTEPLPEDLTGFVLGEFTPPEAAELDAFLDRAAEAIERFFRRDIQAVMNEFNG